MDIYWVDVPSFESKTRPEGRSNTCAEMLDNATTQDTRRSCHFLQEGGYPGTQQVFGWKIVNTVVESSPKLRTACAFEPFNSVGGTPFSVGSTQYLQKEGGQKNSVRIQTAPIVYAEQNAHSMCIRRAQLMSTALIQGHSVNRQRRCILLTLDQSASRRTRRSKLFGR